MADYIATARSNYFRVKDAKEFEKLCNEIGATFIDSEDGVGFYNYGPIPYKYDDDDDGDDKCFIDRIKEMLVDKSVVVIQEIGYEKMRYLIGYAIAFNNKGDVHEISISDIMNVAMGLGENVTEPEY